VSHHVFRAGSGLYIHASIRSLHFLAVPVVTIFKNVASVFTMIGAWFLFGETASAGVVGSLSLCVLGAFLSGASDITPNAAGYVWVLLNCLSTAAYVLYMRSNVKMKLSVFEKALYNNMLMVPTVSVLAMLLGEWPAAWQAEQWENGSFITALVFSGAIGFLLNMASIWCVDSTGATTYAMVGAINKVPVTFVGYFLFDEVISSKQWMFVVLSLAAGCLYAYVKANEHITKPQAAKPGAPAVLSAMSGTTPLMRKLDSAV
jgi:GDP-mannose transporter